MKNKNIKEKKIKFVSRETILLFFAIFITLSQISVISLSATTYPYVEADAAMLMDANSGSILYGDNIDQQVGIASISKLMALYVCFDEMKEQNIALTDKATVSARAALLKSQDLSISGAYFEEGQQITYEELIKLSLIYSDNTAILVLAENLSGSEQAHVDKMNQKAVELGMENSNFVDVTGLTMSSYGEVALENTKSTDYNKSSARDIGILTYNLLADYPEITDITKQTSIDYNGETLPSYNQMLPGGTYEYPGVTGLKTGSSGEAGYCFVGLYTDKNDTEYISVVLGAGDDEARFSQTAVLYDWINTESVITYLSKDQKLTVNLNGDNKRNRSVYPKDNIKIISGEDVDMTLQSISYNPDYFDKNNNLTAEIPAGETIFTANYVPLAENTIPSSIYSTDEIFTIQYVSRETIKKENILSRGVNQVTGFFKSLYDSII